MSRVGRTGPQRLRFDNGLLLARATVGWHTATTAECRLARKMAHDGADLKAVHEALGWDCSISTTRRRLRRLNINPQSTARGAGGKAHRGLDTSLPRQERGIDMHAYRPKAVTCR